MNSVLFDLLILKLLAALFWAALPNRSREVAELGWIVVLSSYFLEPAFVVVLPTAP